MSTEIDAVSICVEYSQKRLLIDFYVTSIFASMVTIFGVFGNAATLLTLSGRRLGTAAFVYYRTIAKVDLYRCIFVFTYVLRVLIPFRRYYWTTWYEAHFMYFAISTLGFISTTLAVLLCFRLCTGIVQSTRLKKIKADPRETGKVIYCVLAAAFLANVWLCFEYDVLEVNNEDCPSYANSAESAEMREYENKKYTLAPSQFNFKYSTLLKSVHTTPIVILLILLGGTVCLLVLSVLTVPGLAQRDRRSILTANNSSLRGCKPWRSQRQLCHLFIFLSISYGSGLLPSFLHFILFGSSSSSDHSSMGNTTDQSNGTLDTADTVDTNASVFSQTLDSYRQQLEHINMHHSFATVMNVFQNLAHALSFYVYVACNEGFRNEFVIKTRQAVDRALDACPFVGILFYTPLNQPSSPQAMLAGGEGSGRRDRLENDDGWRRQGIRRKCSSDMPVRKNLMRDEGGAEKQAATVC